jgi:hypothetical protein
MISSCRRRIVTLMSSPILVATAQVLDILGKQDRLPF